MKYVMLLNVKPLGKLNNNDMKAVAIPVTKEGYEKGLSYAKNQTDKKYQILDLDTGDKDANCATFGLEVVRATTGTGNEYCLPNPGAGIKVAQMYSGAQTSEC